LRHFNASSNSAGGVQGKLTQPPCRGLARIEVRAAQLLDHLGDRHPSRRWGDLRLVGRSESGKCRSAQEEPEGEKAEVRHVALSHSRIDPVRLAPAPKTGVRRSVTSSS
jgi:hypothetical protein